MSTKVGLWIDHKKAIVVAVTDKVGEMALIISAVEKQARRSLSSRHEGSYEPLQVPADDSRQRAYTGHLNIYYDAVIASIRDAESMLDGIGGVSDVLNHGNRVAIKVNLTGGTTQAPLPGVSEIESYLTHPEVVRALGELLRDAGVTQLFIVEAAYEPESWPHYGYTDMAKSIDATLVDLTSTQPYKDFAVTPVPKDPFIYDKFTFNPILNEVDAFVSVSKMKCHATCGVTHTMKNLVGLVPYRFYTQNPGDKYRSGFHGTGGDPNKRLPRVILDLNRARPVNLGLIDGIWTIERGEGPWVNGVALVKPGVLFAGKDPVATDAVATAAMGFDPTTDYPNQPFLHADNHLNIAKSLGLGTNRLEEIKVVGATIDEVRFQFKPSY